MATSTLIRGDLRLGFGCSGAWGKRWFSETKAGSVLQAALESGVTHVDTAGFYDEAETRLGGQLKQRSQYNIFISTKTGTAFNQQGAVRKDFSKRAIEADVSASLTRLGRDRIDLLYLHGPNSDQLSEATSLKEQGKIKYAGVCGEGAFLSEAAGHPEIDVVMGAYNFLRQEHETVFAKAKQNGKSVVAIAPLAQGLYRRDFFLPRSLSDGWHLARALVKNRSELQRARAVANALDEPNWTPAGLALAFVLANENIDVALTTTTKINHLSASLHAARRSIPESAFKRLRSLAADLDEKGTGA